VEYGLILPVFLLLVLGLVDTGRLLWTYTTLAHAVDAAARCGAVNSTTCGTVAAVESYAVTQAYGLNVASSAFTETIASCGVEVSGTFPFVFIIPWLNGAQPFGSNNTLSISVSACYPV
jgi:Flp pilus assembly protein TadG